MFFLVADFGFDLLLITEIARNRDGSVSFIGRYFTAKMFFSVIATLGMILIAFISNIRIETKILIVILSTGIIPNAITGFCCAVFKGHESFYQEVRTSFIQNIFLLIMLIVLAILKIGIIYIAIMFVLSRTLGAAIILQRTFNFVGIKKFNLVLNQFSDTFKTGLPFGIHLLFGTLYFQLDTILLAYLKGDQVVGIYQAAMKLMVLVLLIPDVLSNVFMPLLARLHITDKERWKHTGEILVKTLLYISLPIGLVYFLYADDIISIVYGTSEFHRAIPILQIFSLVIIIRFCAEPYAMVLTVSQQQKTRMVIVISMTILNLGLNLYAIPKYGVIGAAYVSLLTNVIASCLYIAVAHVQTFRLQFLFGLRQFIMISLTIFFAILINLLKVKAILVGVPMIAVFFLIVYYFVGYSQTERALIFSIPKDVRFIK